MKSVLSLDEIQRVAQAMRDKIKALKVNYQYTSVPTEAEIAMRPACYPTRDQRRTFVMRGSLQSSELEGLEDGKQVDNRYVMDGTHIAFKWGTHDRESSVARIDRLSKSALSQFVHREPFCLMADIQYSGGDRFAGGGWSFPYVLPLDEFHVRENQEKVGDRWCHVIEWPRDAHRAVGEIEDGEQAEFIWVDSDNPAIMVKKESCFIQEEKIFPWLRKTLGSFREVEDGVWLPMQIESEGFPFPNNNAKVGTLVSVSQCTVTDIKLNSNVTDKDFAYRLHKGEKLGFCSAPDHDGGSSIIHQLSAVTDSEHNIPMPLDQPANETIKRLVMEKDPAFFS